MHDESRSSKAARGEAKAADPFVCRVGCGACCIAPSIATPFYGMPQGKQAGERCVHLDGQNRCVLFGRPERPRFCGELKAEMAMCGATDEEAMAILTQWERATRP